MNNDGQFTLRNPSGEIIARGSMSALLERVNQSKPRMNAEAAIQAAAKAVQRERDDKVRADALDRRETEIEARERQADAAAMRSFCDGVAAIGKRLDALEEVRGQERLAGEIAAADAALRALGQGDDGDLESKLPRAEEIELHGGASEAGTAINKSEPKSDDEIDIGVPSLPQQRTEPYRFVEPLGALPDLAKADMAEFGRTFVRNQDRRAARRAIRSATRR
jgi:hypothetical protein